jgi:hypothetical protein
MDTQLVGNGRLTSEPGFICDNDCVMIVLWLCYTECHDLVPKHRQSLLARGRALKPVFDYFRFEVASWACFRLWALSTVLYRQCFIDSALSTVLYRQCFIDSALSTVLYRQCFIDSALSTMLYRQCPLLSWVIIAALFLVLILYLLSVKCVRMFLCYGVLLADLLSLCLYYT